MADLRRLRPLLGTFVEVGARDPRLAPAMLDAAFASLEQSQARWSFQEPDSELSRLNRSAGEWRELHPQTLRLLRLCRALMVRSGGRFDCTVGGLLVREGCLPDHGGPTPLPRGVAGDIEIDGHRARLRRPLRLTLDGIAKGYAVDLALAALRRSGAAAGWINAGGDLRAFGALALPVQRRELDGRLTPLGALRNAAMASSRVGPADPAFPSRLVAPGAGAIAPGVWTVLARTAWRADALAKIAAVSPDAARAAAVARLGGLLVAMPSVQIAA